MAELGQEAVDVGADVLDLPHVGGPGDEPLAVGDLGAFEEADMGQGVIADVNGHPGPIGAVLEVLAQQHGLDVVLPGAHVLLVGGKDGPDIVARAAGDGVPAAAGLGGVGEGPLRMELAHGIALAAIRGSLGVGLIGVPVLVKDRTPGDLEDVGLGDHGGDGGGQDHPGDRPRRLDATDDVVADPGDVGLVLVGAHVGDVGHAMAAPEDVVVAAVPVKVRGVQGQPARSVARHGLQEGGPPGIIDIAHAGADPIAPVEQQTDRPASKESCRPGDGHGSALWNGCHVFLPCLLAETEGAPWLRLSNESGGANAQDQQDQSQGTALHGNSRLSARSWRH